MRVWLKKSRTDGNITQFEISKKAGIAQAYYAQIERGLRKPSVEVAKKIAIILNFDWTKFFEESADKEVG